MLRKHILFLLQIAAEGDGELAMTRLCLWVIQKIRHIHPIGFDFPL